MRPGDSVLDAGSGCAHTTVRAARAAERGHALGVDLAAVTLARARRLTAKNGVRHARFELAGAQTCAFPPGWFDVTLPSFGMMFSGGPPAAFANVAGALRPGCKLVFPCW